MYDVDTVHIATSSGGIEFVRTMGKASNHSVSERMPWRAIFGGMGEEKRRSQLSTTVSISLRSVSIM